MTTTTTVLWDFSNATSSGAEPIFYGARTDLNDAVLMTMAPKVDAYDDHDDGTIDTDLWSITGSVTETSAAGYYLSVHCLMMSGPSLPAWDDCAIIYKPAITPTLGTWTMCRLKMSSVCEFVVSLQEYEYTVDDVTVPTTWTPRWDDGSSPSVEEVFGVNFVPGDVKIYRGGAQGTMSYPSYRVDWRAATSKGYENYYITVGFKYTATGYEVYVMLPGIWTAPKKIHTETRSSGQPAYGYSLVINKRTPAEVLGFYNLGAGFKSDCEVDGIRLIPATTSSIVNLNSFVPSYTAGGLIGKAGGSVLVRFPDYSSDTFTLTEVAQLTTKLTGYYYYRAQLVLTGDIVAGHPITGTIET